MKVYIVTESEAREGGGQDVSVDSLWFSRERAEERARSISEGVWSTGDVDEMGISDATSEGD